jgi:hypothetical protein
MRRCRPAGFFELKDESLVKADYRHARSNSGQESEVEPVRWIDAVLYFAILRKCENGEPWSVATLGEWPFAVDEAISTCTLAR